MSVNVEEFEAELCDNSSNPKKAKLSLERAFTNTTIHVFPAEIDTFEFKSTSSSEPNVIDGSNTAANIRGAGGVTMILPLLFASTYFKQKQLRNREKSNRTSERNPTFSAASNRNTKINRSSQLLCPNLVANIDNFVIKIVDDSHENYATPICTADTKHNRSSFYLDLDDLGTLDQTELISTFRGIDLNFDKSDNLVAFDLESYSLESVIVDSPTSTSSGNYPRVSLPNIEMNKIVDIRTAKARKSSSILSASWNDCLFHCNLYQANIIVSMADTVMTMYQKHVTFNDHTSGGMKLNPTRNRRKANFPEDLHAKSAVQLSIVQGTFDQPSNEMTVVQMQRLSVVFGGDTDVMDEYYMDYGSNQQGLNSLQVEALHATIDHERHEVYLTTTQITTCLSEASLQVAFKWAKAGLFINERYNSTKKRETVSPQRNSDIKQKWEKMTFRAGSSTTAFRLANGIEVKFATGVIKLKYREIPDDGTEKPDPNHATQNCSFKDLTLSMWSLTGGSLGNTETPRAMLKRVLTIPCVTLAKENRVNTSNSTQTCTNIVFPEKVKMYWSTLIHRVFVDVVTLVIRQTKQLKVVLDDDSKIKQGIYYDTIQLLCNMA